MGRGIAHPQPSGGRAQRVIFTKEKLWGDPLRRARAQPSALLLLSLLFGSAGRALREGTSRRGGWRKTLAAEDREGFLPLYKGLMRFFDSTGDTGQRCADPLPHSFRARGDLKLRRGCPMYNQGVPRTVRYAMISISRIPFSCGFWDGRANC